MRRLAENNDGEFALFVGNRYLICRPKFEEYLQKLMKNPVRTDEVIENNYQNIEDDLVTKRQILTNIIINLQDFYGLQTELSVLYIDVGVEVIERNNKKCHIYADQKVISIYWIFKIEKVLLKKVLPICILAYGYLNNAQ